MDSKIPSNSEIINNVRNLAISRRGGVRTRGGRLPPISMRDISASNKKVIAPKIPQRRKVIKTEPESSDQVSIKTEGSTPFENTRSRGRGRQQKVYLQTQGTFLAEGPAARVKRDPAYNDNVSVPRVSRKSGKASCDKSMDADAVKDLMKSYVDGEEYENDHEGKPPFRLPLQKDKTTSKVKLESDSDDKTQIKKEIIEDFETGIKKEIKTEIDSDFVPVEGVKIKSEEEKDIDREKLSADNFLNVKDDGTLILLQLPLLPGALKSEDSENDKGVKEKKKQPSKENEPKTSKFIDNFKEGFIGKLKIMKSGRMKVTLGSIEFELLDGTPSETYQEAVSIKLQDNEEADATVLGKVENKLIISPIINKLLADNVKNSKTLSFEDD